MRRGRRQLVALAALFFVPLAVAFWLYYGPTDWRPAGGSNKGDLIDPARPLPAVSLPMADGSQSGTGFLRGKWTMLYVGDGACDERCRKALYLTRQSRTALNKDMDRIQRVFLATGDAARRRVPRAGTPGPAGAASCRDRIAARLVEPIPAYVDGPVGTPSIYVVDPLGNLMMRTDRRPQGTAQ